MRRARRIFAVAIVALAAVAGACSSFSPDSNAEADAASDAAASEAAASDTAASDAGASDVADAAGFGFVDGFETPGLVTCGPRFNAAGAELSLVTAGVDGGHACKICSTSGSFNWFNFGIIKPVANPASVGEMIHLEALVRDLAPNDAGAAATGIYAKLDYVFPDGGVAFGADGLTSLSADNWQIVQANLEVTQAAKIAAFFSVVPSGAPDECVLIENVTVSR